MLYNNKNNNLCCTITRTTTLLYNNENKSSCCAIPRTTTFVVQYQGQQLLLYNTKNNSLCCTITRTTTFVVQEQQLFLCNNKNSNFCCTITRIATFVVQYQTCFTFTSAFCISNFFFFTQFHILCGVPIISRCLIVVFVDFSSLYFLYQYSFTGGGVYGFLFCSEFFFRTLQELEYLFILSLEARNFFPEYNIRLYDKNSESDYFIFLHQNQNIFSATLGIRIFFRKKPFLTADI